MRRWRRGRCKQTVDRAAGPGGAAGVSEARAGHPSEWTAISLVAEKVGCRRRRCASGCAKPRSTGGQRPAVTTEESAEIKRLWREN